MFLAGRKNTVLKSNAPKDLVCPKCSSNNSTKVSIIGTYKHLLQIPFLSGGKSGVSSCLKCNESFESSTMPDAIKLTYFELKEITKTPIWFYAGLITIKTLVLIKIFSKYF